MIMTVHNFQYTIQHRTVLIISPLTSRQTLQTKLLTLTHPPPRTYIYVHQLYRACATDVLYTSFIPSTPCAVWHSKYFNCGTVNMLQRRCPLVNMLENTFWYDEYANKASQWLVCLCSRSRSGQLALQAAGQCTGPCTLNMMPLMTNRVKQSHQGLRRVAGCPGFLHSVCESVMCEQ